MSAAKDIQVLAETRFDMEVAQLQKDKMLSIQTANRLIREAQEICLHDKGENKISFEDYHKREYEDRFYCLICNKHIRTE